MTSETTLVALAREHTLRQPDKIFATIWRANGTTDFTYGDLWVRAGAFACALHERRVGPGDLVIVSHELAPDLYAAFVGAMMIGATPAIMPYPNVKQRDDVYWDSHRKLYAEIRPAVFVLSDKVADLYAQHMPHTVPVTVRASSVSGGVEPPGGWTAKPGQVAFLQHSSGTTALKKGVMLTHEAVTRHVTRYAATIGCGRDSVIASWLPLYHDMGLIACFMMPLALGATVLSIDPFEWVARPRLLLDAMTRGRAQFAWIPNFGLAHLVNAIPDVAAFDLTSLEALINCSEPCRPATQARFVEHFAPAGFRPAAMQVCYAMAENVFAVSQTPFRQSAKTLQVDRGAFEAGLIRPASDGAPSIQLASCGALIESTEVRIVDDHRQPAATGCIGEIAIRSDTLFAGYNRRSEQTAKALVDGWYYTNDLGFVHDGELYVTGRRDDLILAYGRNYFAHELEAVVNTVDGVRPGRATVFGVESDQIGTCELVVLFESADEERVGDLVRAVRGRLEAAAGVQPRYIEAVATGSLIKTTSGKISRSANRDAFVRSRCAAA